MESSAFKVAGPYTEGDPGGGNSISPGGFIPGRRKIWMVVEDRAAGSRGEGNSGSRSHQTIALASGCLRKPRLGYRMETQEQLISQLQVSLDQVASQKTKDWWEKYLRYVIPFRGVGIPEIRNILALWHDEFGIATWGKDWHRHFTRSLFEIVAHER